jgi:hypothetical protein
MIKLKTHDESEPKRQLFDVQDIDTESGLYETDNYFIIIPEDRAENKGIVLWIYKSKGNAHVYITEVSDLSTRMAWRSDKSITISN